MTAALDFLRGNWQVMFRTAIYMLLPLSIVQTVALNSFFGDYMGLFFLGYNSIGADTELGVVLRLLGSYGVLSICFVIGSILLQALAFTMVQVYNERENGLEGVTRSEIRRKMRHNVKKVLKSTLSLVAVVLVFAAISFLNPIALILLIPALIAMSVPMQLFPCIYTFEETNMKEAASRALRLGLGTWTGLFLINLIMGFVINIIEQVVAVPWGIATVFVTIFTEIDDTPEWAMVVTRVLSFLFGVLMMFVTYMAMMIQPLATTYHYAHATERKDSISVDSDIDNFENLE